MFAGGNCLLCEAYTSLCNFLGPLRLPGSEVQLWDLVAAHKVKRVSVGLEDMSWYFKDAGVVTYYS